MKNQERKTAKEQHAELTESGEAEFLEKLECLATLGITGSVEDEVPFFILEDMVKLRRMELEAKEVTA